MADIKFKALERQEKKPNFPTKFIFELLEESSIRYALVRGYDELCAPHQDIEIDILVHPADLAALKEAIRPLGFVQMPPYGYEPHYFFLAFSNELGYWIKLDVVTALYFGQPIRKYKLDFKEELWQSRRKQDIFALACEHEFVSLLLHCLLDKNRFDDKHRRRLRELVNLASEDDDAQARFKLETKRFLEPVLTWEVILRSIKSGEWHGLLNDVERLNQQLAKMCGWQSIWFQFKVLLRRRLRPLFLALKHPGLSVVLLAPDGAGKSTLAKGLLDDKFWRAKLIYMGTNLEARTVGLPTTPALMRLGRAINKRGERKTVHGILIRAINLVNGLFDHWYRCLAARYYLRRDRLVVFDRFIYDSWIQKKTYSRWKRLRRFLFEVVVPQPDLVVFLDAPGQILYDRKQEHSPEWIDEQRAGYHQLRDRLPQMVVVDAAQSARDVRKEVTSLIWKKRSKR